MVPADSPILNLRNSLSTTPSTDIGKKRRSSLESSTDFLTQYDE